MYLNVWAEEQYINELGHECFTALTPEFQIYYICYPSLDDRLLGATSYSSLDIPELTGATVVLNEGNTHGGLGNWQNHYTKWWMVDLRQ